VTGHHDHHCVRIDIPQGLERLEAVPIRQPDIEEDHVRPLLTEQVEGLFAARGHDRAITLVTEDLRKRGQNSGLVVDEQNQFIHRGASLLARSPLVNPAPNNFGFRISDFEFSI
jgi:hypothetical protein